MDDSVQMHVTTAEFVTSAAKPAQFLQRPIPHFVFAGRSNVGKSSILNKLLNRKNLAKTSQHPGKTRLINYFLINNQLFFVDIPGYGYAKVSKTEREQWRDLMEAYLNQTPYLALIFQLLDIRHGPSEDDMQMLQWLSHSKLSYKVLLTKADKLSKNKIGQQRSRIARLINIARSDLIPVSVVTGLGLREVWSEINQAQETARQKIFH